MKQTILLSILLASSVRADVSVLTNDTVVATYSDSFGSGTFGQRQNFFLGSYYINYHPQYFISYRDHSRSGANNGDMADTRIPRYGMLDAVSTHGITNMLSIYYSSGNGGFPSNTIYGFGTNIFQAYTNAYTTNLSFVVHDWTQANPQDRFDSFAVGDVVYNNLSTSSRDMSYGLRSAAIEAHKGFSDTWSNMYPETSAYAATPSVLWFFNGGAYDHPNNAHQYLWSMRLLTMSTNNYRGIGADTNTFTCKMDVSTMTVTSTNHCVISSLSGTPTSFVYVSHYDRMAPGFYVPNGIQTNDCRPAFSVSLTDAGNFFHEDTVITGLPVGIYEWDVDDKYTNTVTSAQLAAGYNNFTNFNNPLWTAKNAVLSNMCLMSQFSPTNASDQINIGNNQLNIALVSIANTVWPTNTPGVDGYYTRMETGFGVENALFGMDKTNHLIVQQVLHTNRFKLLASGSGYVPAPFVIQQPPSFKLLPVTLAVTNKTIFWNDDPNVNTWLVHRSDSLDTSFDCGLVTSRNFYMMKRPGLYMVEAMGPIQYDN